VGRKPIYTARRMLESPTFRVQRPFIISNSDNLRDGAATQGPRAVTVAGNLYPYYVPPPQVKHNPERWKTDVHLLRRPV
jgi:hypothetical protein